MVIVTARILTQPGKRSAFIEAAQTPIAATRREEGCITYELFASTEDENRLMYYEQWADRAALARHMESAHMKEFARRKQEENLQVGPSDVKVYDVA